MKRRRRKKKEAKNFASNFAKLNLQSPRVNSTTTTTNCYSLIRWHITAAAASGPISPTEQRASFIKILLSAADDDDDDVADVADVADVCLFFMPVAVVRLTENLLFNF